MNSISWSVTNGLPNTYDVMDQKLDQDSDESLMLAYSNGSQVAFEKLYRRHKGGLFRYFFRNCHSRDIAEELFQDVWMKVVNARASYEQSAKFTTYLYRIAHNRLVDHYRHLSSAQHAMRSEGDNQEIVENQDDNLTVNQILEQQETNNALKAAVQALPFEQREAILMQQDGHLSLADIAEVVGTSRETIKSRLRYAMQKLRDQLGELKS